MFMGYKQDEITPEREDRAAEKPNENWQRRKSLQNEGKEKGKRKKNMDSEKRKRRTAGYKVVETKCEFLFILSMCLCL